MHDPLRYNRRPLNRRRRRWLYIATIFLILIVIGGILYAAFMTPIFQIQDIEVKYAETSSVDNRIFLPPRALDGATKERLLDDIRGYLQHASLIASVLGDRLLFAWPDGPLEDDFVKLKAPYATSLTISKSYFSRQIEILVGPRESVGVWCIETQNGAELEINAEERGTESTSVDQRENPPESASTSRCWWFDKNGFLGEEAARTKGNLVINVLDTSGRDLISARRVLNERLFKNFLKILRIVSVADFGVTSYVLRDIALQEIQTSSYVHSRPQLLFTLRADSEFTAAAINELKKIELEKIEYADLRVEGRMYYKLK